MSQPHRVHHRGILCLAFVGSVLAVESPAWSEAIRYTFTGQVVGLFDADNYLVDFPVGISVGEEVLYSVVIDFDRDGRVDNLTNPATHFADWIAGEHLGAFDSDCTTRETFPFLTVEPWETEMNFVQLSPTVSLMFLGSPRDTLFLTMIGFDGTPETLQVGVSFAQTVELVCDLFGQGPVNIVSILILQEIALVTSSSAPGGIGNIVGRLTESVSGDPLNCAAVVSFVGAGPQGLGATNEDGDYIIPDLGFATYTVEVFAPGYVGQTKELTLGKLQDVVNFELTLGVDNGVITGTVTDADTGAPLSGVRVEAVEDVTSMATTFTCAAGFYELQDLNLKGSELVVLVSAPSYEFDAATVMIGEEHDVALAKSFFPGTITGIVLDANGTGLEDATVSTVHTVLNIGPTAATNEDGLYISTPLPDGSYIINISKPGFISTTLERTVEGNVVEAGDSLEAGDTPEPVGIDGTGEGDGGCSGGASGATLSDVGLRSRSGDLGLILAVASMLVWRGRRTRSLLRCSATNLPERGAIVNEA